MAPHHNTERTLWLLAELIFPMDLPTLAPKLHLVQGTPFTSRVPVITTTTFSGHGAIALDALWLQMIFPQDSVSLIVL